MNKKRIIGCRHCKLVFKLWWILLLVIIIFIISFFGPTIIEIMFNIGEKWNFAISSSFGEKEILDYFGIILAFLGTVFLGGITLWQNHQIEKNNNDAQEQLNSAVEKLAEANQIIAGENRELIELEKENQRIQLLLAQEFVPFLEFVGIGLSTFNECGAIELNRFYIEKNGDITEIRPRGQSNVLRKQIMFKVFINEYTTLQGYIRNTFQLTLDNNSKARINEVDICSISVFNNGTRKHTFTRNELAGDEASIVNFSSSDRVVYNFTIICSDDYSDLFQKNIQIIFRLVTTTGVSFTETLTIKSIGDTSPEFEYTIEGN